VAGAAVTALLARAEADGGSELPLELLERLAAEGGLLHAHGLGDVRRLVRGALDGRELAAARAAACEAAERGDADEVESLLFSMRSRLDGTVYAEVAGAAVTALLGRAEADGGKHYTKVSAVTKVTSRPDLPEVFAMNSRRNLRQERA
jgi:hypothetical protein